jgi:hypothetical protein
MPITAICLLKIPSLPLPTEGPVRVEALEDSVLLHTTLDFADDPEDVAGAVRSLLGETLADQHQDARGVYLIPSVAAPRSRSYVQVIEEVAEGGAWAPWEADEVDLDVPLGAAGVSGPDISALLGSMLGSMPPGMLEQAAAGLREDPSALRDAAAQLPGMLQGAGGLEGLLQQGGSQLPELAEMLRTMGLDVGSPELARLTGGLQQELARDPTRLIALAEGLFGGRGLELDQDDDDDDADEDDNKQK